MHVWLFAAIALAFLPISAVYAHTVDAIDNRYRVEIGWINEPVFSGETNGIDLLLSPLTPCPDLHPIVCAESQEFRDGIAGLEDDLKVELLYRTEKITLPLEADHNMGGRYYAFVDPTVAGFYQVNLLGNIADTQVSMSLHPPKVNEREYIEFPIKEDQTERELLKVQSSILEDLSTLKNRTAEIGGQVDSLQDDIAGISALLYAAMALGGVGVATAAVAILRR